MSEELSTLRPNNGARRNRMRVGRGEGSGKGKTCGKGTKGAQVRSGYTHRAYFEGGQMPLARRLPKVGFTNIFAKDFEVTSVARLGAFDAGSVVDAEALHNAGIISRIGKNGVKILGNGDLSVALHVRVAKLTKSASDKILAAGGTVEGDIPA